MKDVTAMPDRLTDTGSAAVYRALNRARRLSFLFVAGLLAATFTVAASVSAQAAPPPTFSITPDSGSTAGGTEVTVTPPAPPGVTFTSVSVGLNHSLAVGSDGKTYAWGQDTYGGLGDGGANADQSTPVAVVLPAGVTFESVSAGAIHSLAVGSDGKVYSWGYDGYGQLGDGGRTRTSRPRWRWCCRRV